MTFFVLLALLWVLLWRALPDASPGHWSFTDVLRGLPLLFSLMAFGFAVLMLVIRYWGLELIQRIFPHTRWVIWLGQHAYQYSQPNTTLYCQYLGPEPALSLTIETAKTSHRLQLNLGLVQILKLGFLEDSPQALWIGTDGTTHQQALPIKDALKKWGRNLHVDVHIHDTELSVKVRQ